MRCLKRNKNRTVYYSFYVEDAPILDEDGYEVGEPESKYTEPKPVEVSVSAGSGYSQYEVFGRSVSMSNCIQVCDVDLEIDENSILWVYKEPQRKSDGSIDFDSYDYTVSAVARSINSLSIAIKNRK